MPGAVAVGRATLGGSQWMDRAVHQITFAHPALLLGEQDPVLGIGSD